MRLVEASLFATVLNVADEMKNNGLRLDPVLEELNHLSSS